MSVSFDIFRAEAGRWKTPVKLAKKEKMQLKTPCDECFYMHEILTELVLVNSLAVRIMCISDMKQVRLTKLPFC